jgi:hypothetical protein
MTNQQKTIAAIAAAAILGFAVGMLVQYAAGRGDAQQLRSTQTALTFKRIEATLGAATVEAQRGSYEIARQLASEVFSSLQAAIGQAEGERRQALEQILQRRDDMITALSRGDPQSGSMLAQLFTRYRIAMGEHVGPDAGTAPAPAEDAAPAPAPDTGRPGDTGRPD